MYIYYVYIYILFMYIYNFLIILEKNSALVFKNDYKNK